MLALAGSACGAGDPDLPRIATNQIFDVTNTTFAGGAYGDGLSNNAAAIQAAINAASASIVGTATGGTVRLPANGSLSTYLSGPITMKNFVNLQVDSGVMLQMLPKSTWPSSGTPFIITSANNLHDMEITGAGTIDGQCSTWGGVDPRPNFIQFDHASRILVQGVTLQNPPKFTIYVKNSDGNLTVQNMTINTPNGTTNTDGMDLSSTNVLIRNCSISDGDDNIEIGGSALAANIAISNCTFGTGHGLSLGSTISGMVTNLVVSNCTWIGTEYGIHMKSDYGSGSFAQNLTYRDLTMSNVNFAIAIYSYYNEIHTPGSTINISPAHAASEAPPSSTNSAPIWRNITISNVTVTAIGANIAGIIWGTPSFLASNITLSHVNISAPNKTFCIYNAAAIQIIDSNLTAPNTTTNTLTIYNAQITITNSVLNTNLVTLGGLASPPTNNVLAFFNASVAVTDTNVLGAGSITLGGSTLTLSQGSVNFSNNLSVISASTLAFTGGTNAFRGVLSGAGTLTLNLRASTTLKIQSGLSSFIGNMVITNSGVLQFDQGTNGSGGSNPTVFDAGASGTINNHYTNGVILFLGAVAGGPGSTLQGSDQPFAGHDLYVFPVQNTNNTTFAGTITDGVMHSLALEKFSLTTTILSGANTYSGGTTVGDGTLLVNNTAGSGTGTGAVSITGIGTLGGTGVIGGPVTVSATLAPGNGPGTLTVSNNLVVNNGATLLYELGTNGDLTVVSGNLTVGGTLNATDAGGFTTNTYTLFAYGGTLTYSGLTVGTVPNTNFTYTVSTNVPGQVNLVVSSGTLPPPLDPFVAWQLQHFSCTNLALCPQAAGDADPDGDGMSNTNEFLSGTDPTNSASALRIISAVRQTTDVVITWTTVGGFTNAVQAGSGDVGGGYTTNFADVSGPIIISGVVEATTNYVDGGGATNVSSRFYRVRLVP